MSSKLFAYYHGFVSSRNQAAFGSEFPTCHLAVGNSALLRNVTLQSMITVAPSSLILDSANPGRQTFTPSTVDPGWLCRSALAQCGAAWLAALLHHSQQETGREQPAARSKVKL